jgi:hypothetical protein
LAYLFLKNARECPHTLLKMPTGEVRSAFSLDPDGMLIQLNELVEDKA